MPSHTEYDSAGYPHKVRTESSVPSGEQTAPTNIIDELKAGLESIGIEWVEPTDIRNRAGSHMLKRGVKMGVAVDPGDVQGMLVEFAEAYAASLRSRITQLETERDHFAKQNLEWANCAEKSRQRVEQLEQKLASHMKYCIWNTEDVHGDEADYRPR